VRRAPGEDDPYRAPSPGFAYAAYSALTSGLFLTLFPPFWAYARLSGRHLHGLRERIGLYPEGFAPSRGWPRIWIHAVSVGEVRAAACIIECVRRLLPGSSIVLSSSTATGNEAAHKVLSGVVTCTYAPIDFIGSVRRALDVFRPDILACVETEIWPHLIVEARRRSVRTALLNGRISVRSIGAYLKVRPLMRAALGHLDALSMISREDAERIQRLGAPPERIEVHGNAKYDHLRALPRAGLREEAIGLLGVRPGQNVFVAGSTRTGEEAVVLDVFTRILKEDPGALLVLAPRHTRRVGEIARLITARGLVHQVRSQLGGGGQPRTAQVVLVDTMGELPAFYSVATVVFCGGSMVPLGGQNVLEAAVWKKPVLYGHSMEDFAEARDLLETAGAGIAVKDADDLAQNALYLMKNPSFAAAMGEKGHAAILQRAGASERHAKVLVRLLSPRSP